MSSDLPKPQGNTPYGSLGNKLLAGYLIPFATAVDKKHEEIIN